MNRNEFMTKLEALLADISKEEREEALQYYRDYFEDAGAEHEMEVLHELESPEKVAATIKADLKCGYYSENGEYTECGYRDERFETKDTLTKSGVYENSSYTSSEKEQSKKSRISGNFGKVALIVAICLIGAPIIIPIAIAVIMLVFGIALAVFSLFAGLVIGAIAILVAGVLSVIMGIPLLIVSFPSGVFAVGVGLIAGVIGLIGTVAAVKLCMIVYPVIVRFIVDICRKPFHNKKETQV